MYILHKLKIFLADSASSAVAFGSRRSLPCDEEGTTLVQHRIVLQHLWVWFVFQAGEGVAGERVFLVGGMPQLADFVYRDYHSRIQALNSQVQHTKVREIASFVAS